MTFRFTSGTASPSLSTRRLYDTRLVEATLGTPVANVACSPASVKPLTFATSAVRPLPVRNA